MEQGSVKKTRGTLTPAASFPNVEHLPPVNSFERVTASGGRMNKGGDSDDTLTIVKWQRFTVVKSTKAQYEPTNRCFPGHRIRIYGDGKAAVVK